MISFGKLREAARSKNSALMQEGKLLALDPGETTGTAVFDVLDISVGVTGDQIKTWPIESAVENLANLLYRVSPRIVVMESYQVYEWKTDTHSWSNIPTLQVIGCIQTLCIQREIPFRFQTAQIAKTFVTDEKLEAWGMWHKGLRHGRDATRHGCYYLLFGDHKKPS